MTENKDKVVWPNEKWVSHLISKRWPEPEKYNLLIQICESGKGGVTERKENQDERAKRLILEIA